jgi:hypothetical protein
MSLSEIANCFTRNTHMGTNTIKHYYSVIHVKMSCHTSPSILKYLISGYQSQLTNFLGCN